MKILILQCFDKPGGQSNRSYLFANQLQKLGHEITYYTNRYNHLDKQKKIEKHFKVNDKIKYIYIDNKKFKNNKFLSVVFNSLSILKINQKFDIIIGPSVPLINSFFGLILSKLIKAKFFYEIRDVWPEALVYNKVISKYSLLYIILKILEIKIYKFCNGVISSLPNTKNYISYYNNKIPQIYLPNSYLSYPKYKKRFRKKKIKVFYVGRFNADHNIKIILEAAHYLMVKKKTNIIIDLYGYGEKLNYLKKKIIEKKLKNIRYKSVLKKTDIFIKSKKYDLALCTLTNSKAYQWGINLNKIYEYLNSSMPIIFSGDVPSNPVLKAKCGFVCKPNDYKTLAKNILKYENLSGKNKIKLSNNAKFFFDTNYNLRKKAAMLDVFLRKNCNK